MSQGNGNATFLEPSSSDVDRRSRISYTREFLLSLAKAEDSHSTVKLPWDLQLSFSCVFQDSTGLLSPPPLCVPDSRCQNSMPQKNSLNVLDDVNLLHRSNEPYRPPRRHKALPPSNRDGNDLLNGDTSGSSECTNQEKAKREGWGKGSMEENTSSPEVKIQQELKLNSSNIMLHENSNVSSELCLPDEDSLITFDEPFLMHEIENLAVIDSSISNPESSLVEDDLFSPSSPHDWAEKLVESIIDDESSPDPYLDDPMVHSGAGLDAFCLSMYARQFYTLFCSNQLNPGRDQQEHNSFLKSSIDQDIYSLFSHSYPSSKIYQPFPPSHDDELIRFDHEVSQSRFQQMINPGKLHPSSLWVSQSGVPPQLPELQMAFCTKNLNPMQNCLGHKKRPSNAELFIRRNSDFHGDAHIDQAVVDSFVDTKLRATL